MEIKLKKTELNKILEYIRKDDETIGLICDLIYIYARNITEVAFIKKEDINLEEGTILFHINQNNTDGVYPIHKDVLFRLKKYMETDNDYIFEDKININKSTGWVNEYLSKKNSIFKNLIFKNNTPLSLSTIDFKILRGQHLFLEGVSLESIHELYHYKNLNSTKRIIDYNNLTLRKKISISELFEDFTNINIYKQDEYMMQNQFYCTYDNKECVVIIDKLTNEMLFDGDNYIKRNIKNFNFNSLTEYGDYTYYNKIKILKI